MSWCSWVAGVNEPGIKLTTYFSERDRSGGHLLSDALFAVYERHELHTSVLLRGVQVFGRRDQVRSNRLLLLSENLPAVSIAIDSCERVGRAFAGGAARRDPWSDQPRARAAGGRSRPGSGASFARAQPCRQAHALRRPLGQVRSPGGVRGGCRSAPARGRGGCDGPARRRWAHPLPPQNDGTLV